MIRRFPELPPGIRAILPWLARVRWTTALLFILHAFGGGILYAAPQHPNLFVNVGELDQLAQDQRTAPAADQADAGPADLEREDLTGREGRFRSMVIVCPKGM